MKKKSKGKAILEGKCPHCRKGPLFQTGAYQKGFMKMHDSCPECGVSFLREPRFFDGAMYISYAMNVGLFLTSALIIYQLFSPESEYVYLTAIILEVILLYPLMFRYSRILYLYAFGNIKFRD